MEEKDIIIAVPACEIRRLLSRAYMEGYSDKKRGLVPCWSISESSRELEDIVEKCENVYPEKGVFARRKP